MKLLNVPLGLLFNFDIENGLALQSRANDRLRDAPDGFVPARCPDR